MGMGWRGLGDRPAVVPVVACLGGIVWGPQAALEAWVWLSAALVAGVLGVARHRRVGALLSLVLAGGFLGAGLAELQLDVAVPAMGEPVRVTGTVEGSGPFGFTLAIDSVDERPARFSASIHADDAHVLPGARLAVEARFRPHGEAANPGEWNRAEWAWRRGAPVVGTALRGRVAVLEAAPAWRRWMEAERAALGRDADHFGHHDAAAFLLTLAAGARAELGDEVEESFARSGLAHVLSVSGLHVAVLALTLFAALRWLLCRRMLALTRLHDPRAFAGPLAVPVIWAYVLYTGWQAPAVRSAVMCSLLLCGWPLRRRSDALNALALAALVMIALDPAAPFELSVQLSFLAVAALTLLAPVLREAVPIDVPSPALHAGLALRVRKWREAVLQTVSASLAVTLTTGPLVLSAFQRVSVAGLISNVVTLPLSGVLTLVAAGGAALHLVSARLAWPLLWAGVQLSRVFLAIAEGFAASPASTVEWPAPPLWLCLAWWFGLSMLALARGRWRWLSLVSVASLALHVGAPRSGDDELRVTFLAVGHGDATVISVGGHHALVDGGGVPHGHDTGQRFVLPFLRTRGITGFDVVALSHAHPDHALGLASTLAELPTRRLWLPREVEVGPLVEDLLVAAGDAVVEEKQAGDPMLPLGGASLEVLGPPVDRSQLDSENDRSLVLLLRHGAVTFLLTGDIEAAGEAGLAPGPVTVLKAPHHGSDTSSTPDFAQRTRPRHVVFCVGRHNRFGFPRAAVVARWESLGAECHRTDLDGAITFISDGRDVRVETFQPVLERRARTLRAR